MTRQEKEKIVFFDEFAVYDRPSLFYAWAEKNTKPEVKSNESKRNKVNGLLSVDVISGEEYIIFKKQAKTEDIATYFAALSDDCVALGITKLTVIWDNNSTHKKKLQYLLKDLLNELESDNKIEIEFIYTPTYSPNFTPFPLEKYWYNLKWEK